MLNLYLILVFVSILSRCDRSGDLKVEISTCAKQLAFIGADFTDTSHTTLNIKHLGFCYDYIDSLSFTKEYISGSKNIFAIDTGSVKKAEIEFADRTDKQPVIKLNMVEISDTAESISVRLIAVYKNNTKSNPIEFSYQLPCKKEISNPDYVLMDTMSCETSAGTGDRFMVSFTHTGYCTQDIDSIVGHGDFYSYDGYFWNSSSYQVPKERIILDENNTYQRQISHKLCITFNYSDFVHNRFYAVYHDGTRSNELTMDIKFDYKSAGYAFKTGSGQMK